MRIVEVASAFCKDSFFALSNEFPSSRFARDFRGVGASAASVLRRFVGIMSRVFPSAL